MNKVAKIFLIFFVFFTKTSVAQTLMDSLVLNSQKINFENIKQLSDMLSAKYDIFSPIYDDCDSYSEGINPALRHCLRIQLQREDSLLKKELQNIVLQLNENKHDTLNNNISFIEKIELTQEIWERYRFAYCNQCLSNYRYSEKADVFSFLRCAIELTIKRREEIKKMCMH
ncbi:MAG: hypothetical protein FWH23_06695 [Bacteroidales bacterium]|nr:hypothetical protein [Bacteroidales bacterium]